MSTERTLYGVTRLARVRGGGFCGSAPSHCGLLLTSHVRILGSSSDSFVLCSTYCFLSQEYAAFVARLADAV